MTGKHLRFKQFFFSRVIGRRNFTYRLILEILQQYLEKGARVLDAGCGDGNIDLFIGNFGASVVGVDLSRASIKTCREKAKRLGLDKKTCFVTADMSKYKSRTNFDLVVCNQVLEHVKDDNLVLKNLFALIKADGILILSVPSKKAPLYRWGIIKEYDKELGHLRRYTIGNLEVLVERIGFRIIKSEKTEGVFRNFLFFTRVGAFPLRFANRFTIISDIFTFIDNITLKLFGESQIIVVAQKPKKKK